MGAPAESAFLSRTLNYSRASLQPLSLSPTSSTFSLSSLIQSISFLKYFLLLELPCLAFLLTSLVAPSISYAGSFSPPQLLHVGEPQDSALRTLLFWVYTHSLGHLIPSTLQFRSPTWTVPEFCVSNCLPDISICL